MSQNIRILIVEDQYFFRLALHTKGPDRAALITDAFSATGLPDGEHTLGPHRVFVRGPLCTLADGTIAGSILTMDRAVRNAVEFAGVSGGSQRWRRSRPPVNRVLTRERASVRFPLLAFHVVQMTP